jgi:GR25 family glycosyltransferase involved in LPS biosynthesis
VITMPEFPERFQRIKSHATAAGVPLQSFPGVKVTPQEKDKLPPLGIGTTHFKDRTGATFNLGVVGSFLAHRNLMGHIARSEKKGATQGTLIFEDDVVIPPDFRQRLAAIQAEVPADWDVLFLDKFHQEGRMVSPHIMKLERDMTAQKNWGFWAFIVRNPSVANKILQTMEHMLDVADIQLNKFAHKINMYLVQPGIVTLDHETASKSTITAMDLQKGGASPLKVFVYANDPRKPAFQLLLASLKRGGYDVHLLGEGQPWRGFAERMRAYQAAAAAEPPGNLIAFLDGYDSMAILPASVAVEKFLARPRAALPILFSAEPYCLGNCHKEQLAWFDRHPTKLGSAAAIRGGLQPLPDRPTDTVSVVHRTSPVFLNGGAVMGRAGALASLYAAALETGDIDDQRALGKLLAASSTNAATEIDLDVEGSVFRTKVATAASKMVDEGSPAGPALLHFPGMYGKEAELLQRMSQYL